VSSTRTRSHRVLEDSAHTTGDCASQETGCAPWTPPGATPPTRRRDATTARRAQRAKWAPPRARRAGRTKQVCAGLPIRDCDQGSQECAQDAARGRRLQLSANRPVLRPTAARAECDGETAPSAATARQQKAQERRRTSRHDACRTRAEPIERGAQQRGAAIRGGTRGAGQQPSQPNRGGSAGRDGVGTLPPSQSPEGKTQSGHPITSPKPHSNGRGSPGGDSLAAAIVASEATLPERRFRTTPANPHPLILPSLGRPKEESSQFTGRNRALSPPGQCYGRTPEATARLVT